MSRTNVRFVVCLLLICSAAAVVPASAQHFEQIPGSLNYISAGRSEVWGILCTAVYCSDSNVYRFNSGTKKFVQVAGPPNGLQSIVVGGGSLLEPDEVWGIENISYNVYRFNFAKGVFVQVPGLTLSQIAVGYGNLDKCHPYEVWGVWGPNVANPATYRYNYCTSGFDNIPNIDYEGTVYLSQIATGGGDVWAIGNGQVWEYYVDESSSPAWWGPGPADNALSGVEQISVGVNDVWAVSSYPIYQILNWAPSTQYDIYGVTLGVSANQTATGGDGVWVIYDTSGANGLIARYDFQLGINSGEYGSGGFSPPFSLTSPAVQIAVGSGAGVWAIDTENRVYAFVRP